MFGVLVVVCSSFGLLETRSITQNSSAVLISKYAKVAHWGAQPENVTEPTVSEGRSHSGQTFWTQRSDVKIVGGQNLKSKKPVVVYAFTSNKKPTQKSDRDKVEVIPAVGEVQERFNPKPYFRYTQIPPKSSKKNGNDDSGNGGPPTGQSFESYPVYNAPQPSQAPVDLYTSPYSSYNPPQNTRNGAKDSPNYPPAASQDSYAAPPSDTSNGGPYDYAPSKEKVSPPKNYQESYASLGPPLSPDSDDDVSYQFPHDDDHSQHDSNGDGPPNYPPKDEHDIYYPPDTHGNQDIPQHNGMNGDNGGAPPKDEELYGLQDIPKHNGMNGDHEGGPPNYPPKDDHDIYYPPDTNGHQDMVMDQPPDMAEHDLAPPPSENNGGDTRFPQYLYDHGSPYDFDNHHVYEEVPHPTTTEAPQRAAASHYSYYYLGRKLWYIPLYFSIYFIIYVTILILKSIARHKIHLKHEYLHDKRKARQMNYDEEMNQLHQNVTTAVESAQNKYSDLAM